MNKANTYVGKSCKNCGTSVKYASNYVCVVCNSMRAAKRRKVKEKFYKGSACNKCKQNIRYSYNGHCVKCLKNTSSIRMKTDKAFGNNLKRNYNSSLDEYNTLFKKQNGKCAICRIHQKQLKHRLCMDHDHSTLQIRGLLCHACNQSLGKLKENPEIVLSMLNYLKEWS